MRRKTVSMLKTIFSLIVVSALTSCEHKELCLHHPHTVSLRIEFDWQDAPDANPAGMCVFFYPESGGTPVRYDVAGTQGREIDIVVGRYRIITYNNDTEVVQFANTDLYDSHIGFTREGSVLEGALGNTAQYAPRGDAEDERVVATPDLVWGCTATDVVISETGVSYVSAPYDEEGYPEWNEPTYSEAVITLYPHDLVCNYTYEIRNVENLEHMNKMCGSLSGMSGMLYMASEDLHAECVTLPFPGAASADNKIEGQFYTFGHHEDNDDSHLMTLYVWMNNGDKYVYGLNNDKFNVTSQVHSAPDRRRVHIIIDGLSLPSPLQEGGGFDATVDDWIEENVDIVM